MIGAVVMAASVWFSNKVDAVVRMVGRPSLLGFAFLVYSVFALLVMVVWLALPILTGEEINDDMWRVKKFC